MKPMELTTFHQLQILSNIIWTNGLISKLNISNRYSILIFLNRKNPKIRGPLDFHLGVSLCEKIWNGDSRARGKKEKKKRGRERRPCERESCAIRKVEGCGVFWEGSHRITTRSDLVGSPVSHCSLVRSRDSFSICAASSTRHDL